MKVLDGKLTISRTQSNQDNPRPIRIELTDNESRCRVVEILLSLCDFSEAITGRGYVDCKFEYNDSGKIGMVREIKTVAVPYVEHEYIKREEAAAKAIKPFEVDGWKGSTYDYLNHHNRKDKTVTVGFQRWVEKVTKQEKTRTSP